MKKKSICSFILAITLIANCGISAYAADTTTQTTKKEVAVTTSTTQKQVQQQQTQMNMDIKTDSTDINQQYSASPNSMGNTMASFNFNAMSAQNFTLPEMSGFTSEADMQEKYDKMIAGFTNFGFGKQASLSQNSGYSQSIVQSFSDQFGTGLASDFKNCQLTFDPNTVFNEAATKRNQLFGNLKNDKTYNLVQSNFNISGVMAKINSVHLDPNDVKTEVSSPDSLEWKIRGAMDSKYNDYSDEFKYEKEDKKYDFQDQLTKVDMVKTRLSDQGDEWFRARNSTADLRRDGASMYMDKITDGESDFRGTTQALNKTAQNMASALGDDDEHAKRYTVDSLFGDLSVNKMTDATEMAQANKKINAIKELAKNSPMAKSIEEQLPDKITRQNKDKWLQGETGPKGGGGHY